MSGLWSSSGSVIISWIVGCGHVLGGSVFMSCVYGYFSDRGLWSCPGSVVISWLVGCDHALDGSVVMFWICGHVLGESVVEGESGSRAALIES